MMSASKPRSSAPNPWGKSRWGSSPWFIDFHPASPAPIEEVDFAIVGGGFTGLSAAAWLRHFEPKKTVALFECNSIGAGASGRTGGMALAESAAGDLPGLGDVLGGLSDIVKELSVDCDLALPGTWEVGRTSALPDSPISWQDSGNLRVVHSVPGGTLDPGKLVSGLALSAENLGAQIYENAAAQSIEFGEPLRLRVQGRELRAQKALVATNAMSLEISGLAGRAQPVFTLAVSTAPLSHEQLDAIGLASGRPFYTVDFPYLWGRLLPSNGVIFGSGLVHVKDWRELEEIDISKGEAGEAVARLEHRVRGLHPALRDVRFTNQWGGPILIPAQWRPVLERHPRSAHVIVAGGYAGHGVALSVYLGRWAAEAMLGHKDLPAWGNLTTQKGSA